MRVELERSVHLAQTAQSEAESRHHQLTLTAHTHQQRLEDSVRTQEREKFFAMERRAVALETELKSVSRTTGEAAATIKVPHSLETRSSRMVRKGVGHSRVGLVTCT